MHALIIEDEFLIAAMIEDVLRDIGFTTFDWALTQEQAIDLAKDRRPDLITADVMLNPGNGVEAVREIRHDLDVPVVFVTSTPESAKTVDRVSVVRKPFTEEQLRRALERSMGGAQKLRTVH
jgi:DNA-binding response OmpR family regulator